MINYRINYKHVIYKKPNCILYQDSRVIVIKLFWEAKFVKRSFAADVKFGVDDSDC